MSLALLNRKPLRKIVLPWAAVIAGLVILGAGYVLYETLFADRALLASSAHPVGSPSAPEPAAGAKAATTISLPEGKWKVAGIKTEAARTEALPSEVGVAARIEPNPDHRFEIRPRAAGIIRTVGVKLVGQHVKKGETLAVLDSPEVGTARLNLRSRQIELATAQAELDWKRQVADNVAELIPELLKGMPADAIQKKYADRPLGSDRAMLLQSYAENELASHEFRKQSGLLKAEIIGEHPAVIAQHTFEGTQQKLQGLIEQVKFDARHELTLAEQKTRLAESAVVDAAQRLKILGVAEDIPQLLAHAADVAASRSSLVEDVTAYEVTAPFEGTIIEKAPKSIPGQRADVSDMLFVVADLRTVWVMGNMPESNLAYLSSLHDGKIRLTAAAYPGQTFEAKLLTVGAVVDPTTRTVPLLAETANPRGLLKLGMFARILIDTPSNEEVLTVPVSAVVEIDTQPGVFVPSGRDGRTYTFRPVKLGRAAGDRQVVAGGLSRNDSVVSAGAFFLKSELILQNEPEED